MKSIFSIILFIFLLTGAISCSTNKYPVKYSIYKGDKEIFFPKDKIEITLLNDTVGVYKNYHNSDTIFIQNFNYEIVNDAFLLISNLDTLNQRIISLNNNDTITIYQRKMLFFYDGNVKALLYFRKSVF